MPKKLMLTDAQRRSLRQQMRQATDVRVYKRALALMELWRGRPVHAVAQTLQVHRSTVDNWRKRYLQMPSPKTLQDRPGRGRRGVWTQERVALLQDALRRRPVQLGYMATEWTAALLIEHLQRVADMRLSDDTLRRKLHRLCYRYNRPGYVLLPDPAREKKARHSPSPAPAAARHGGSV
jgi:transposase